MIACYHTAPVIPFYDAYHSITHHPSYTYIIYILLTSSAFTCVYDTHICVYDIHILMCTSHAYASPIRLHLSAIG